jgi:hypothetical protein
LSDPYLSLEGVTKSFKYVGVLFNLTFCIKIAVLYKNCLSNGRERERAKRKMCMTRQ